MMTVMLMLVVQVQVQISFIAILHYIEHCQSYYTCKFNKTSYLNYYNSNKYLLKCKIIMLNVTIVN